MNQLVEFFFDQPQFKKSVLYEMGIDLTVYPASDYKRLTKSLSPDVIVAFSYTNNVTSDLHTLLTDGFRFRTIVLSPQYNEKLAGLSDLVEFLMLPINYEQLKYIIRKFELSHSVLPVCLDVLVSTVGDLAIMTDISGNVLKVNSLIEKTVHKKSADLEGKPIWQILELISKDDFSGLVESGKLRKQIELVDMIMVLNGVHLQLGGRDVFLLMANDISEQLVSDQVLRESQQLLQQQLEKYTQLIQKYRQQNQELKSAITQLKDSSATIETIFYNAPIGITLSNTSGKLIRCNLALQRMLGYTEEELSTQHFSHYTHPDDRQMNLTLFNELKAGKRTGYKLVKRYIKRTGEILWGQLTVSGLYDQQNKPTGLIAMVEDITLKREKEIELKLTQQRLAQAIVAGHLAWWELELESGIVNYDRADKNIRKYFRDKILSIADFYDIVHADDREFVKKAMENYRSGMVQQFEAELRICDNAKNWFWIYLRGEISEWDKQKSPTHILGIVQNISNRKLAELEVLKTTAELEQILHNAQFGILKLNIKNQIEFVNNQICVMFGYTRKQMLGQSIEVLCDNRPELIAQFSRHTQHVAKHGSIKTEQMFVNSSENSLWALIEGKPIYEANQLAGYTWIVLDITDQKRLAHERAIYKKELEHKIVNLQAIQTELEAQNIELHESQNKLQNSEKRYLDLYNFAPISYVIISQTGEILEGNRQFKYLFKITGRRWIHYKIYSFIANDDMMRFKSHLEKIEQSGKEDTMRLQLHTIEGDIVYSQIVTAPVFTADNILAGFRCAILDINQQRNAEQALIRSENIFRTLYEDAPIGILMLDENRDVVRTNDIFADTLEYNPEDLISLKYSDLIDKSIVLQLPDSSINTAEGRHFEAIGALKTSKNEIRQVIQRTTLVKKGMDIQYWIIHQIDISKQKKFEEELHTYRTKLENLVEERTQNLEERNQQLSRINKQLNELNDRLDSNVRFTNAIVLNIPLGLRVYSHKGEIIRQNEAMTPITDIWSQTKRSQTKFELDMISELGDNNRLLSKEITVLDQNSKKHRFNYKVFPLQGGIDKVDVAILCQNITEEWRAQMARRLSEYKFRSFVEQSPFGIAMFGDAGVVYEWNAGMSNLLGISEDKVLGLPFNEAIASHPDSRQLSPICAVIKDMNLIEQENRLVTISLTQGQDELVMLEGKFFTIDLHEKFYIGLLIEDVTAKKRAEQDMQQALEKEKELNLLKTTFVSMASHQFKTPLTTIQSSSELLQLYAEQAGDKFGKQIERHSQKINQETQRLNNMINDFLLIGRVETGKTPFKPANIDVALLIKKLIESSFDPVHPNRKVELLIDESPVMAFVDPSLFNHVISNLVENAYKYSQESPCVQLISSQNGVGVHVSDTGIGIPEHEQDKVFQSFYRASNVENIKGTGLGLIIAKQFVEMHGGTISFTSKTDEGTTFSVFLPHKSTSS